MDKITKDIKFVVVYARVSTSAQEVQETIQAQLLEVEKFAKEKGYTIVERYLDEGWSGDTIDRPAIDQLRLDAKKKKWDAVLIYDPDRLGRRYYYQELVMHELLKLGIETLFVTIPPAKDFNDRMSSGIRGLFAEYERAKIADRFRMGKVYRVTSGNVLVSEAPYGYNYINNHGKKGDKDYLVGHYEINNKEADVVKDIFRWIADDGLTLRGVVKKLQELGVKPRKSKRGVWSTSTLSNLVRNETYIGIARWGTTYAVAPEKPQKEEKYKRNEKTSRRISDKNKWHEIAVPRILESDDIFTRAGKKLKDNFALMGRNKKNDYLLAGKIWCTCGKRRTGEGPQQGKHLYYRCNDRVNSFPLPRSCKEKGVNAKIVDLVVWQRLEEIMQSPEMMKAQIERYKTRSKNINIGDVTVDVDSAKKQIIKLKTQMERYNTLFTEDIITLDQMKEHHALLTGQIKQLDDLLTKNNLEQRPPTEISFPSYEEIKIFAKEAKKYRDSLSFWEKKGIIASTLDKTYSNQKSIDVYGSLNLHEIYVKHFSRYRNRRSPKCW